MPIINEFARTLSVVIPSMIPLVIIIILALPFLGKNGGAAAMAYAVVGLLPAFVTVSILREKAFAPAAIWLGIIWIMLVFVRIQDARRQAGESKPEA